MVDKMDEVPTPWHPKRQGSEPGPVRTEGGCHRVTGQGPLLAGQAGSSCRALPGLGQHSHRLLTVASVTLLLKSA